MAAQSSSPLKKFGKGTGDKVQGDRGKGKLPQSLTTEAL
ncbi:hypothetical protein TREPR_1567 [Treponema primitia ZAS-2]|uniref:Uncharacterized protein n=1 Tax=Treponema primitia (strain ATCC BAA-887 / DSM 12427 / ZAS-2) TaxID=545694 RepID=F5YPD8_TREPZ|nr:hypothetical protein TREPR_1567 [Treponema primitia ZAS-2]